MKRKKQIKRNRLPADRSKWSARSRNAMVAGHMPFYEDIVYSCRNCRVQCIFTAEAQKHTFEVKKQYIYQECVLYEVCFTKMHQTRADVTDIEQQWREEQQTLAHDEVFLREWLNKLKFLRTCTHKPNARLNGLENRLARLQQKNEDV